MRAEELKGQRIAVNALFPHRLAGLARACGARLIHLSTDCVFAGREGNYDERARPDAEDLYGRTLRVAFEAKLLPNALPRERNAPVTVHLAGAIRTTDGSTPPQLREISIARV